MTAWAPNLWETMSSRKTEYAGPFCGSAEVHGVELVVGEGRQHTSTASPSPQRSSRPRSSLPRCPRRVGASGRATRSPPSTTSSSIAGFARALRHAQSLPDATARPLKSGVPATPLSPASSCPAPSSIPPAPRPVSAPWNQRRTTHTYDSKLPIGGCGGDEKVGMIPRIGSATQACSLLRDLEASRREGVFGAQGCARGLEILIVAEEPVHANGLARGMGKEEEWGKGDVPGDVVMLAGRAPRRKIFPNILFAPLGVSSPESRARGVVAAVDADEGGQFSCESALPG
ncbi:hypothetical protein HWV62_19441 [Athelia sp. TMB]|nr:hypothetical protein HWV62_19441 [Athelia sp. TMB]